MEFRNWNSRMDRNDGQWTDVVDDGQTSEFMPDDGPAMQRNPESQMIEEFGILDKRRNVLIERSVGDSVLNQRNGDEGKRHPLMD